MKRTATIILPFFIVAVSCAFGALGIFKSLTMPTPAATIAATSTNFTKGTEVVLEPYNNGVTLYANAVENGAAGTVTIRYELWNGSTWTSAAQSNVYIPITMSGTGTSTNIASQFFVLPGVQKIRVGGRENTTSATISTPAGVLTYTTTP